MPPMAASAAKAERLKQEANFCTKTKYIDRKPPDKVTSGTLIKRHSSTLPAGNGSSTKCPELQMAWTQKAPAP